MGKAMLAAKDLDALKQELVEGAALVASIGLVPLTQGNLSLRDPASGHVLMTPHDYPYDQLTTDGVLIMDLAGNVIEGEREPSHESQVHLAVYERRADAAAIVHAEPIYTNLFGVLHKPLDFDDVFEALKKVKPDGLVLIADDDPDFVASLEEVLTEAGYSVAVAHSGDEALKKGMENDLEALILDLRMPVINGFDVFMELKKQGRKVPTIIVTGYADEEAAAIETLRHEKASGCLVKPFDPLVLLEAIEAAKEPVG